MQLSINCIGASIASLTIVTIPVALHPLLHGTDPLCSFFHHHLRLYRPSHPPGYFPNMSSSKPSFFPVTLGHGSNCISVQLLKFPPTDAPLLDKVQAFAYFEEVIQQFRSQLSSATLQQAYATTIPVSSSAAASEDSNRISQLLTNAFYSVQNLSCLGFYTANRKPVRIDLAPVDRAPSIRFVEFEATVNPVAISLDLRSVSPVTVTFFLRLPQSIASTTMPRADVDHSLDAVPATADPAAAATAMVKLLRALASGTTVAELDLTDPSVSSALATLAQQASTPHGTTPITTPRKLFDTPASCSIIGHASPSICRHLTTAQDSSSPTYCGALDFLDSQSKFDAVFPPNDRKPISSLRRSNDPTSLLDPENPATHAMNLFTAECRLIIFSNVIRLDYIGRHDFSSAAHLHMTVKKIRSLTLDYNTNGRTIRGNPDGLFNRYIALTPLLPASHVNIWGINLFSQFWDALGDDLTRRISCSPRYLAIHQDAFDLTMMVTKSSQMDALREIRTLASECHATLQDDRQSMRTMLHDLAPRHEGNRQPAYHRGRSQPSTNVSSAESTMRRYSASPRDAQSHHQTFPSLPPPAELRGEFPADFRGCLGCGGPEHVFRSCPMREDRETIARFHRNFNAKFGRPDRAPPPPNRRPPQSHYGPSESPPPGNPPAFHSAPTTPGAGRGAGRNVPAWLSQQYHSQPTEETGGHAESNDDESSPSPAKRVRNFPLFVRTCQHNADISPLLRPMPIRVDNGLPHIHLLLGLSGDAKLNVLFDSGAALSSGYLPYHLWVMRERPDLVASFEKFDDANPFEPIKLGGAIRQPEDYNESQHGRLTAIIRYKTPYADHDGNPIQISFGLGNDMTVNTILGMPIIKDLGMLPNFRDGTVTCADSPATFGIQYQETTCGFAEQDSDAAVFAALPIAEMYPISLPNFSSPTIEPEPAEPCVDATDDTSKGYLQRHLS
jgi:hypothetical protein